MKRSEVVKLLANWAHPTILDDVYSNNYQEWADNLLYTLETEYGMSPPKYKDPGHFPGDEFEVSGWEDEDAYMG